LWSKKDFESEENVGSKTVRYRSLLFQNKYFGQIELWGQKIFGSKYFFWVKILRYEKILGSKKILGEKNRVKKSGKKRLSVQKIWAHKI